MEQVAKRLNKYQEYTEMVKDLNNLHMAIINTTTYINDDITKFENKWVEVFYSDEEALHELFKIIIQCRNMLQMVLIKQLL
jgi:hypothetical protein